MAALPYMRFYVADYLADTGHLTTIQHGAYMMLIMAYWRRGSALPDDDEYLAQITRMSVRDWKKNREMLAELFSVREGKWHHSRVEIELKRSKGERAQKSHAGVESARKKSNGCSTGEADLFNDIRYQISDSEEANASPPIIPHPTWKPPEPQWSDWIAMRKEMGHPVTPTIEKQAIKSLAGWMQDGHDISEIIEINIRNGWRGMFLPTEMKNGQSRQDVRSSSDNRRTATRVCGEALGRLDGQ